MMPSPQSTTPRPSHPMDTGNVGPKHNVRVVAASFRRGQPANSPTNGRCIGWGSAKEHTGQAMSKLSGDEQGIILGQLCNTLEPRRAVYFSSASSELRA